MRMRRRNSTWHEVAAPTKSSLQAVLRMVAGYLFLLQQLPTATYAFVAPSQKYCNLKRHDHADYSHVLNWLRPMKGRTSSYSAEVPYAPPPTTTSHAMLPPHIAASVVLGSNIRLSLCMALIHIVLGSIGTPFVAKAIPTWYMKIDKPSWTPPNRIFGPTWTLLYTLMGISFSRVVQQLTLSPLLCYWKHPLTWIWMGHVLLNVIWAPVFFGLQQLRAGLYMNYGLLFSLCCLIIPWYMQIDMLAAYLLLPYTVWLLYATCLNQAICARNPGPYNTARFYANLAKLQRQAAIYADS
jgi:translocator protein